MTLRGVRGLYERARSPGQRVQMAVIALSDRRRAAALAAEVARLAVEYVHDERGSLEHAIDVAAWWSTSQADSDGLLAARGRAVDAARRADDGHDRGAWLCLQASAQLAEVALEPMIDLAAKRARDLTGYVLDAMCWPDLEDDALRRDAEARLHDALDALFDATSVPALAKLQRG